MKLTAKECLVVEDSVAGIKAAMSAGMHVFAVTNDITHLSVHQSKLVSETYIIDDLTHLKDSVYKFIDKEKVAINRFFS